MQYHRTLKGVKKMTKSEILRKLTSRKLWVALAGFISGLYVALGGDAETAETITGLIMSGASVLGYLLAEGLVDAAERGSVATIIDGAEAIETK